MVNTAVSPCSPSLRTFRHEERLRLSDRNSVLMMYNLSGIWSGALIGGRSSYIVLPTVSELQTKDKRPQRSNVNVMNLLKTVNILRILDFQKSPSSDFICSRSAA